MDDLKWPVLFPAPERFSPVDIFLSRRSHARLWRRRSERLTREALEMKQRPKPIPVPSPPPDLAI